MKKQQEKLYEPILTNDQLNQIAEPQAKLIYENAIGMLKGLHKAIDVLMLKAHIIYLYSFTMQMVNTLIIYHTARSIFTDISTMCFLANTVIYFTQLIIGKKYISINNTPERMISEKALSTMAAFYIVESIGIERYAIPYNVKANTETAFWIKVIAIATVLQTTAFFM